MEFFQWRLDDGFDYLLRTKKCIFADMSVKQCTDGDYFYYLVNDENKTICPLPFLSYAFGGQYSELPIGCDMNDVKIDLDNYKVLVYVV